MSEFVNYVAPFKQCYKNYDNNNPKWKIIFEEIETLKKNKNNSYIICIAYKQGWKKALN